VSNPNLPHPRPGEELSSRRTVGAIRNTLTKARYDSSGERRELLTEKNVLGASKVHCDGIADR
jgi:hypothetical protein